MMKERRDWIQEQKVMNGGKPPPNIEKFKDRNNLEAPMTSDELAAKAAEDEAGGGKKGKKEAKKKEGKKGKKCDKDDDEKNVAKIGPSEVI